MGRQSARNICTAFVLLVVSAAPLATALANDCGSMPGGEMAADAPDRCAGLWGTCCDFGPPSSRTIGDSHRGQRTPSLAAAASPTAMITVTLLTTDHGAGAPGGRPHLPHEPPLLELSAVLRI